MQLSTGNSTSIIPFYASSIHRADSSGAICLLTDIAASLSRRPAICSISMRDFDRAFSRRPLRGISCPRRGRDDSSESGTNLRATMVSPSLSVSREGDTEGAGNAGRCVSFEDAWLSRFIHQHQIRELSSGSFRTLEQNYDIA